MNNSDASESTEIAYETSNTQHTSGVATSENQNMQVAVGVEQPIVIGTSFNQQQDPVQDIENPNLEEYDKAPPNFFQQQHIVEDNDPNQNRGEQSGGGINNSGASESTEITSHVSNTQHTKGVATSERNYDQTIQDIENQNMQEVSVEVDPPIVIGTSFKQQHRTVEDIENPNLEEYDGAPPNFVQQQHTVENNDPNQNLEGVAPASPSLILQLPNTIQDDGSQTSEVILQLSDTIQDDGSQTSEAEGSERPSDHDIELMYRAAFEGDWAKAEKLLKKDQSLAYRKRYRNLPKKDPNLPEQKGNMESNLPEIETERKWYRPLHVAVASKHDKFALKLIGKMEASNLLSEDSNGLTACSYAAASGNLDIAKVMIEKSPNLAEDYIQHLFMATLSGKSEVVSFFLERTPELDPGWEEEWLELLNNAIVIKMYGVALKLLDKDGSLATRSNEYGTALHTMAREDISAATTGKAAMIFRSIFGTTLKEIKTMVMPFVCKIYNKFNNKDVNTYDSGRQGDGEMPKDFRSLAKKLLEEIQKLEDTGFSLLDDPPILHDAAKVGNVDLIRMITHAYPDLIWQTDRKTKRSLLDIVIESREANVFFFIQRFVALDLFCAFTEDEDKNNLLHLAAKLGPRKNTIPALQMQSELAWYKAVEAMLPLGLIEEKNKKDKTPRDLFVETHEKLLEESKAWMKSTADSCMLIATIILTVVYAAAFTVPGGNNEGTGLPILVKSNWLTCFFIFEALALFSSTLCIITFWSITCSGFEEDQFLDVLPYQLRLGFSALFASLIGAISAFLSAYMLLVVQEKAWLVKSFLLLIYAILVLAICGRFSELWYKTKLPECLSKRSSQGLYRRRGKNDYIKDKSRPVPAEANNAIPSGSS